MKEEGLHGNFRFTGSSDIVYLQSGNGIFCEDSHSEAVIFSLYRSGAGAGLLSDHSLQEYAIKSSVDTKANRIHRLVECTVNPVDFAQVICI